MSKPQTAPRLLMPKATAVWLIESTTLSFQQIAGFTHLDPLEVQALADGDTVRGIIGRDPIKHGELTQDEIDKAEADSDYIMAFAKKKDLPTVKTRAKGPKYTPVSKRGDKPNAIAWILKHHPEISDAQIGKLVGTTKPTIAAVRDRTHANISNIRPQHPAEMGLCTYAEIEAASDKGFRAQGKNPEEIKAQRAQKQAEEKEQAQAEKQAEADTKAEEMAGFDFSNFLKSTGTEDSQA